MADQQGCSGEEYTDEYKNLRSLIINAAGVTVTMKMYSLDTIVTAARSGGQF